VCELELKEDNGNIIRAAVISGRMKVVMDLRRSPYKGDNI
jgi:hypothetical protein